MFRLFVYGTLQPGEVSYHLCSKNLIEPPLPTIARGTLYALPLGYPAMAPGKGLVRGYTLTFENPAVLDILDRYERLAPVELEHYAPGQSLELSQYRRQEIAVTLRGGGEPIQVWAYTMTTEQVKRLGGIELKDGQWTRRKQLAAFSESQHH